MVTIYHLLQNIVYAKLSLKMLTFRQVEYIFLINFSAVTHKDGKSHYYLFLETVSMIIINRCSYLTDISHQQNVVCSLFLV